ncbi:glycosyltransferase [Nitratidesulfovibrio vulgaris]|uniref:glycosyltransferase n=1 Tax=Nitratidesulfovibrio vulgaris TaxID=881 RepID=UPI0023000BD4|nr:glycosyltransferase [Nitratidesulfovibrio vulgaris]WCB45560.1 glycosyltransferase [Nitratidesulfovibrio vulgaris]
MPRLHVLHVVEAFGAGTFSAIAQICRTTEDTIRHSIAHSIRSETPDNPGELLPKSVQLHHLELCREIAPTKDFSGLRTLIALFKELRPDVIHAHSTKAGVLARIAAWRCNIPVVYTPHGYAFLREDISTTKRSIYWAIEWIAGKLGTVTAACGNTEAIYAQRFGPTEVVCNGIDLTAFPPLHPKAKPSLTNESPPLVRAGICGRIAPQRNPKLFKQLARMTRDTTQWVWIGDGDDLYNLPEENIQITGWLKHQEAVKHLGALDIYVHTSLWEGLPFSIMEAMALERPVVASNIIGNNELVVHGKTGFLANTLEEFAHHVNRLAADSALREELGKAGRQRIAQLYDSGITTRAYSALYRKTCKRI